MDENKKDEQYGSDIKIKSPLMTKLENFWYHYKWHSIVAVFLVVCITVCSLQMCTKKKIDFLVLYASGTEISRKSVDGDVPAYNKVSDVLAAYADDLDGDGDRNLVLTTHFVPSPEEIAEIEGTPGKEVNYSLVSSDSTALNQRMGIGDYYLSIISPYVFENYGKKGDVCVFEPIAQYAPAENELEYYNEYAIKLSSTALYKNNPVIQEYMPEDTLIAIQIKRVVGVGNDSAEKHAHAEAVLRKILAE